MEGSYWLGTGFSFPMEGSRTGYAVIPRITARCAVDTWLVQGVWPLMPRRLRGTCCSTHAARGQGAWQNLRGGEQRRDGYQQQESAGRSQVLRRVVVGLVGDTQLFIRPWLNDAGWAKIKRPVVRKRSGLLRVTVGWLGSGCRGRLPICLCMPRQPAPSTASMSPRRAFSPPTTTQRVDGPTQKRSRTALGAICRGSVWMVPTELAADRPQPPVTRHRYTRE
jgi:hypothetical protein